VDEAMEPLERLLNLVGLLLETEHPMTFEEIRRTLPAYGGDNLDSAKRKFERDKDILREYGVPLEMAATDVWDVEQGYTIPKDRYYLPEIAFTPEEVTALFVAAQSASEETVVARGVRKLLYGAEGGVLAGAESGPLVAGSPGTVVLMESTFPGVVRKRTRDDGWVVLGVPAADEQALAAMLLQFGADVEALEPATLRDEVIRRLKASVDA